MNDIMMLMFRMLRHQEGEPHTNKEFLWSFDTTKFYDPDRERGGVNHLGMHTKNVTRIFENRSFGPFLSRAWTNILEILRHPYRPDAVFAPYAIPTFVFFCNKGRHRSVGMAEIVGHCLADYGYNVTTMHLMREFWPLETCNECVQCRTMDETKLDILDSCAKTVRIWDEDC